MANMHLVTGYAGKEHVTAEDHGAFNAALIGTGQFVLAKGQEFAAQVCSSNMIRVHDGELMMQGRFVRMEPDTCVDLTIENGTQGMMRNDLIVARYTKNTTTGVEEVNLVVIKGTAVESDPVDPEYTEGDITNGEAVQNDFPLWRIRIIGLYVGTPVMLFRPFIDSMRTLPDIRNQVNQIHSEVDAQLAKQDAEIDEKIAGLTEYTKTEVLTDETKAMYGLGGGAVPNDVFALVKETLDIKTQIATGSYVGTGGHGESSPNNLTFDFEPKLLVLINDDAVPCADTTSLVVVTKDMPTAKISTQYTGGSDNDMFTTTYTNRFAFSGKTVSWYIDSAMPSDAKSVEHGQFNKYGKVYYYAALG